MWRALAVSALVLGSAHPASAQEASPGLVIRAGAGVSSSDYTCSGCVIDAETGFTALVAGTHAVGRVLTVGFETTLSRATTQPRVIGDDTGVTLIGALATAGARSATRLPVWGTLGLGWLWYSGIGPNSNGPGLSARLGVDIPVRAGFAVSPFAGYLTMLGRDGPRTVLGPTSTANDPGVATRVASLQLGVALTVVP